MITWKYILEKEKKKKYFIKLINSINKRINLGINIFPKKKNIFNVFKFTKFTNIKVVIIGQDPYYKQNQAHGLAFSVLPYVKIPPTLNNIYKELKNDVLEFKVPKHGFLINWAKQGVFLLNSILTVEENKPKSHINLGWEIFTDKIINYIDLNLNNIIFLSWGNEAKKKLSLLNNKKNFLFSTSHPSPLSAYKGFLGCKHFSITNKILINRGIEPINWSNLKY